VKKGKERKNLPASTFGLGTENEKTRPNAKSEWYNVQEGKKEEKKRGKNAGEPGSQGK
jgi:hypothetical protein